MPKKIIAAFDFDGVVADTLSMLYDSFLSFLSVYDIEASHKQFEKYNGVKLWDIIKDLKIEYNLQESEEVLLSAYQKELESKIEKAEPVPGLESALETLRQAGCKMVISTSAGAEYVDKFLRLHNLEHYFDAIISGDRVEKAKPFPDLYIQVKERYPDYEVIAIEDSDNGLISAFNAGVKTFFYNRSKRASYIPRHFEICDLNEISAAIPKILEEGYFIPFEKVEICLVESPALFDDTESEIIEKIWNARPERMFNGTVLAYKSCKYDNGTLIINGFLVEYKYIYAGREKMIPLAVSAICFDNEKNTIVSVRNQVTDYVGSYELVPSGGIEEKNIRNSTRGYQEQIAMEFCEELGRETQKENIRSIRNIGICFDAGSNTMDICMAIDYDGVFKDISCRNNWEYQKDSFMIARLEDLQHLLNGKEVVYTTRKILEQIG